MKITAGDADNVCCQPPFPCTREQRCSAAAARGRRLSHLTGGAAAGCGDLIVVQFKFVCDKADPVSFGCEHGFSHKYKEREKERAIKPAHTQRAVQTNFPRPGCSLLGSGCSSLSRL